MVNIDKLIEAEILSRKCGKIVVTTTDGRILVGETLDIGPSFDDDGNESDYIVLRMDLGHSTYEELRNEEIESVRKL